MATDSTIAFPSREVAGASPMEELKQLWQVPAFFAGLLALACLWAGRASWEEPEGTQAKRDLAAARHALESAPPDLDRALALAQGVLDRARTLPQQATGCMGEAHFLLGSVYVRRAGAGPEREAAEAWNQARLHLEQAEALGVPEADRGRLANRLGKAWYQTGMDLQRVIDYLMRVRDEAVDDPAERYRTLTQAYLRLPKPNYEAALAANKKELDLPTSNDTLLAPARLLRGRLLLRAHDADQARKVLKDVRPGGPPGTYQEARRLLAQSCQDDGLYAEAADYWEELLKTPGPSPEKPEQISYALGTCYDKMGGHAQAAADAWEAVLRYGGDGAGELRQAAALRAAELRLQGETPASALPLFEKAIQGVTAAASYHNTLLPLEDARKVIEQGCRTLCTAGDFDNSERLARLYEPLATPGTAQDLFGQAAEAWARQCRESNQSDEAAAHLREAGAAYEAVAAKMPGARSGWLWRSAQCYLKAQDYREAAMKIQAFLEVEKSPERLGEGWFALAQVHQSRRDQGAADAALHKCLEYPGRFAYRARYLLARDQAEHGKLDDAEAALKQNVDLMRDNPDDEAYEKTLSALGGLLFERKNYRMAAQCLQEVVDRYPSRPGATRARLQVAECYRRLAVQEDSFLKTNLRLTDEARSNHWKQYYQFLDQAIACYQTLVDDLEGRQGPAPLSAEDGIIQRQAGFALADCRLCRGQYEQALVLCEKLARRYERQGASLTALQQIWRCYWMMSPPQPDKAMAAALRLRDALKYLDDAALRDNTDIAIYPTLKEWRTWLDWATAQKVVSQ